MIKLNDISIGYKKPLIHIGDMQFESGKLYLLTGRNGSGKSTFLKTLGGLIKPLNGLLEIDGMSHAQLSNKEFAKRSCYIGNRIPISDGMRLIDIVAHGRIPHLALSGRLKKHDLAIMDQALETTGIKEIANQLSSMSSDGELQKAFIASGLAQETPIILLDEPTAHLDLASRRGFWKKLKHLAHSQNKCMVVASHNLDMAELYADELLIVYNSRLHRKSSVEFNEALSNLKGEK